MKKVLCAVLAVLLIFTAVYFAVPQLRVRLFVACYADLLEHGFENQLGLPANIGINHSNMWSGEDDMYELILFEYGKTSYGCYYSPDDVPLPFQNMKVELLHNGHYYWEYNENPNVSYSGKTSKIKDKWYYFETEITSNKIDNRKYFKNIIENQEIDVLQELKYYPEIFSQHSTPADISVTVQSDSIMYSYEGILTAKSGVDYEVVKADYQKRYTALSQQSVKSFVESLVDSYNKDGVGAVYYEYNGTPCAFIYEEIPDMDKTIVNVFYPLSDDASVFFATTTNGFTEINDKTIEKICSDLESVSL